MSNINTSSQEVLQKLEQIDRNSNEQSVLQIIQDLEQHQFFTMSNLEAVETQIMVRKRIKEVMEYANIEFMDEEVTERLEALHNTLTAEETVAKQYAPDANEFSMGEMPATKEEWSWADETAPDDTAETSEYTVETSHGASPDETDNETAAEAPPNKKTVWQGAREKAKTTVKGFREGVKGLHEKAKTVRERTGTWREKRKETKLVAKESSVENYFKLVEDYLDESGQGTEYKKIIGRLLAVNAKKDGQTPKGLEVELKVYLDKRIYQQAEVLEARTPELKKLLNESREWSEKKTRAEVHERKTAIEDSKTEREKLAKKLEYVNEDIRSIQADIQGLPEGVKPDQAQIDRLMELRGKTGQTEAHEAQGDEEAQAKAPKEPANQQELRAALAKIDEANTTINKELNMITHGARDHLKKNRKASPETILMHIHGFFIDKKNANMDPVKKTDLAMQRCQKSLAVIKPKAGATRRFLKLRTMEASHKEALQFLGSEKGPLTGLPEKAQKMLVKLQKIRKNDVTGLKTWVNELAKQLNDKEQARNVVTQVISNIQGVIDEKRFFKTGVGRLATKSLSKFNKSFKHAYKLHLADGIKKEIQAGKGELSKEEQMDKLFQEIDNFNLGVMEARENVATDLPDDLKAFLKEHRKTYLKRRAMLFMTGKSYKAGKFGLSKLWYSMKKHPKGYTKGGTFLAAAMFVGAWPATSATFLGWSGWKLGKGLWKRRQRKKGLVSTPA